MRKVYKPHPFAKEAERLMATHERCALWAKPGAGKTVLTLSFINDMYEIMGETRPTLVLAPKRVARDVWPDEAQKWEHLKGLEVVPVIGSVKQRREALDRDAPVFSINYEQLPWLVANLKSWPFGHVVADESTRLKGYRSRGGGLRARALSLAAHRHEMRWTNLTGTPAPNGLEDLWGQTWFLDKGERLGRTYTAYKDRWFSPVIVDQGAGTRRQIIWRLKDHAAAEIHERLSDICLSIDPRDWFDLEDVVETVIRVNLDPRARRLYDEFEEEAFAEMADGEVLTAFSASAKTMKCRQLANGAVYTDPITKDWKQVHEEKLDALSEILADSGGDKLLVVYHFQSDKARLKARFPDALDLADQNDLSWAKAGHGQVWLAQPQSVGHGIDGLQEYCHTVVFFAHDWSLENHDQIIDRVGPVRQMQIGSGQVVRVYYIVARGTIDEVMVSRRKTKASIQHAVFDYMKERKR